MSKDFIKQLSKYANKWVAVSLSSEIVVAAGNSIQDVEKKVKTKGIKDVVITFISPPEVALSPTCLR